MMPTTVRAISAVAAVMVPISKGWMGEKKKEKRERKREKRPFVNGIWKNGVWGGGGLDRCRSVGYDTG